ncbi:protein mono-ADP-ribosyltransferase PARP12-like isoform X2 [Antennarius striatus]|uniref:protein mono-ADP-ribosyltransferase PARP12-like isoform X2 n=1 Tax=Antennarius striatus TaxID=241820 RepID=UPI0035B20E5F
MASATDSDVESASGEDLDNSETQACRFYNSGGCRDGPRCRYLHVCKYALRGKCRNGSKCKLNHNTGRGSSFGARRIHSHQPSTNDEGTKGPILNDGRFYQWQLNARNSWKDIENDHVIEAQYSLPHTKSIKIYNTPYGSVNIDFNRMRVDGKSVRVRRLDDGNTEWIWYFTVHRKWNKYGTKVSYGTCSSVTSNDIEKKFKTDPKGSITFSITGETLEIRFEEMQQVGKKRRRKVNRRPLYRHKQAGAGVSQAAAALHNLSLGSGPKWQFEKKRGGWHDFKQSCSQTDCSITSDDIEQQYQKNPNKGMFFNVKGELYKLDFKEMKQTNLNTKKSRKIRRI